MDIDEAWERIGEFGRAQKKIFFLVNLCQIYGALTVFAISFAGADPGWNCVMKTGEGTGNVTDPASKCVHYELGECKPQYSDKFTSVVTEWDLICSKSSLPNLTQSGFFVGLLLGAWLFGTLTDVFGRKKVFFGTMLGSILSGIGCGASPAFYSFAFFRLSLAFFNSGMILSSYTLILEIVGVSKRTLAGIGTMAFFAIGFPILAILAFFIRDWKALCIVCATSGIPILLLWRIVPESPRWLLVQGEEVRARSVLDRIAAGNGTQLPDCHLKSVGGGQQSEDESVSILSLFKGKIIRQMTLILIFLWFTNCLAYYALSMSAGNLGGNMYISFSISGLVELPSLYASYLLVGRVGRKWCHSSFLLIGGLGCVAWTLLHWLGTSSSPQVVLALIGKFAVAGSFNIVYLYSAELFPTQVRSVGLGVSTIGARTGGIVVPLVLLLSQYNEGLPMLVIGVAALVASVLGLSLPETLNQPMPETLADLEQPQKHTLS